MATSLLLPLVHDFCCLSFRAVLLALVLAIVPAVCEESDGFVLYPPGEKMDENERVKASCRNEGERYFSVAAMFVGFREALEACVIVTVSSYFACKFIVQFFNRCYGPQWVEAADRSSAAQAELPDTLVSL